MDTLPETLAEAPGESLLLSESGLAVLRSTDTDGMPVYLALDFGPHGGGHGHYDKLGFVSYARGTIMGLDPGTQSYASPYHETWDVTTVAHNTVVVDEHSQEEATGELRDFWTSDDISYVRATAGDAYPDVSLARTLVMVPDYVIDRTEASAGDGQAHQIDWVYHNYGDFQSVTPLEMNPYTGLPDDEGYEHLSSPRGTVTSGDLVMDWDMTAPVDVGGPWANASAIGASMEAVEDPEAAHGGTWVARLTYDFSATDGYIVYGFDTAASIPDQAPDGVTLWIRGDGSGLSMTIRLYDETDERFAISIGTVDWTGWREITLQDPETWSHYLGDDDGVFDPPLSQVAVELTRSGSGFVTGAFDVDDIVLHYDQDILYANFEAPVRGMRLRTLGAPDTTLVAADGLGPKLEAVPAVLIRRQAEETTFESLMEFHGGTPRVLGFQGLATSRGGSGTAGYQVWTSQYQDITLLAGDDGPLPGRGFGDWVFDGAFAWYRQTSTGSSPVRLLVRDARSLQGPASETETSGVSEAEKDAGDSAASQMDILVSDTELEKLSAFWEDGGTTLTIDLALANKQDTSAQVRILGPNVDALEVNGAPTTFSVATPYITFTWEEDTGTGCSGAQRRSLTSPRGHHGTTTRGAFSLMGFGAALAWVLESRRRVRSRP